MTDRPSRPLDVGAADYTVPRGLVRDAVAASLLGVITGAAALAGFAFELVRAFRAGLVSDLPPAHPNTDDGSS